MRRRRPRNRVRWFEGAQNVDPLAVQVIGAAGATSFSSDYTLLSATALEDAFENRALIERVVGEIYFEPTPTPDFTLPQMPLGPQLDFLRVAIGVEPVDQGGDTPKYDLFDAETFLQKGWMFTRQYAAQVPFNDSVDNTHHFFANPSFTPPYGPYVDVKSKRKMSDRHALVMYVQGTDDNDLAYAVIARLRVLARTL